MMSTDTPACSCLRRVFRETSERVRSGQIRHLGAHRAWRSDWTVETRKSDVPLSILDSCGADMLTASARHRWLRFRSSRRRLEPESDLLGLVCVVASQLLAEKWAAGGPNLSPRQVDDPSVAHCHTNVEAVVGSWLDIEIGIGDAERGGGNANDIAVRKLDADIVSLACRRYDIAVAGLLPSRGRLGHSFSFTSIHSVTRSSCLARISSISSFGIRSDSS